MEIIREGLWICPSCNTKNKGSRTACSGCGQIRGEVEFIFDPNGEIISDEAGKSAALAGPDWICSYCGDSNPFETKTCKGCSAVKAEGKNRETKVIDPNASSSRAKPQASPTQPPSSRPTTTSRPSASSGCLKFGCGSFLFLFFVLFCLEFLNYPQILVVADRNWERTTRIDEYRTIRHEDWVDRVPARGKVLSRTEKIRSHKQVLTGYKSVQESYTVRERSGSRQVKTVTSLGNGRFKESYRSEPTYSTTTKHRTVQKPVYRQDPIYDTFCSYNLDEWTEAQRPTAKGKEETPCWPNQGSPYASPDILGRRKALNLSESYQITFERQEDKKRLFLSEINHKKINEDLFQKLKLGTSWKATFSGLDSLKSIDIDHGPTAFTAK